jgi:dCTP diphosphatase
MSDNPFETIKLKLRDFAEQRDWDQFHSPKNLSMALNVEAAELLEHFQWLTEQQSSSLDADTLSEVADEIADIQVYLIRLADKLGVDIVAATEAKIVKNAEKYPADKVRGQSKKYTKYQE